MPDPARSGAIDLDALVARLDRQLHPAAVLLFGSAAAGRLGPASDIDLAVLLDGSSAPDAFDLAALRVDLESLCGRAVDLVVLDSASPILAMEVLRRPRVLLNRAPERLETFTVRTLGAYFDLKRTRQPIEQALLRGASGR